LFDLGTVEVINNRLAPHARNRLIFVTFSIDVPYIHIFSVFHEGPDNPFAARSQLILPYNFNVSEVAFATSIKELIINESVIVSHLEICGESIIFPISETIIDDLTLEIRNPSVNIDLLSIFNPEIKFVQKIWDLNTTIVATD
jgi:hypothetical protein